MDKPIPPESLEMLEALRRIVAETLERKRRLGHYYVVWKDGKPVCVGEDAPSNDGSASDIQPE